VTEHFPSSCVGQKQKACGRIASFPYSVFLKLKQEARK
jgi:hypothetical protein